MSGWTDTAIDIRLARGARGAIRAEGVLCTAPVWFRWDGATLWQVGSGASPVGEDRIRVRIEIGPGVTVAVRSVAAMVVYAGRGAGTTWDTDIHVADGARLDWRPEPMILTDRTLHRSTTTVHATGDATVTLDEVVVLGRTGEDAGTLRSSLAATVADEPVLVTSIDTGLPGWAGPAGVGNASVVGHRLRLGGALPASDTARHDATVMDPAPGCRLAVAVGRDVHHIRRSLDTVLPGES